MENLTLGIDIFYFDTMKPVEIVAAMMKEDAFSTYLGIVINEVTLGEVVISMDVKSDLLNGFGILHGGISYALADSACAFAANSRGSKAVTIESSISHLKKVMLGESLVAVAKPIAITSKTGVYEVIVRNGKMEHIAHYKGTILFSTVPWE
jgi:acyl-CoA thioesterase